MTVVKVIVDISHPPFGHEHTFAALYVASASLSKMMDVIVILREDGVYTGRKGQISPIENIHLPPTEDQVNDIIELDGRIIADKNALEMRGITDEELIAGVEVIEPAEIREILIEHGEKIVTF